MASDVRTLRRTWQGITYETNAVFVDGVERGLIDAERRGFLALINCRGHPWIVGLFRTMDEARQAIARDWYAQAGMAPSERFNMLYEREKQMLERPEIKLWESLPVERSAVV